MTEGLNIPQDDQGNAPEPRAENINFFCTIKNGCSVPLKVQSYHLDYGKWVDVGNFPPKDIPAKKQIPAFRTSGKLQSPTGTQGHVIYQLGDDANAWVRIYWDLPWGKSRNELKITKSDVDIATNETGWVGEGANEAIVLSVHDLRGT